MDLARSTCDRARHSRDARFDGRFFIAVTSTRVYCRSICPARTAKDENVVYFPSAAAAEGAGFRPCLRCRPEASPGTPAWAGTSALVSRALRLIGEGALDHGSVEGLAERLGVTARHVRRLFLQHLGATPREIALTRRVHFAKKLLDETSLACEQVAYAAGFGSVRRFNSEIRRTFARTPTELRRLARRQHAAAPDHYQFRLAYRPPFGWGELLRYFAARAIAGVEHIDGDRYSRTIAVDGHAGTIEVSHHAARNTVVLEVRHPEPSALLGIVERVRRMFDLAADPAVLREHLGGDPMLASTLAAHPGVRIPGTWDGLELAVRTLIERAASAREAGTIAAAIAATFGTRIAHDRLPYVFPAAAQLAIAPLERVGVATETAATIRALAKQVSVCADALARFQFDDWTAEYIAMRVFGEPDAFPAAGLRRRTGDRSDAALVQRAERWRPWRGYAALLLAERAPVITASPRVKPLHASSV